MNARSRPPLLSLLLLAGAVVSGCATDAGEPGNQSGQYTPGGAVTLQPGGRVVLPDGAGLRYVEVMADSRCPPGVNCIRAGDAEVRFELETASGDVWPLTLNLPDRPTSTVGNWRVELQQLAFGEAPPATVRVEGLEAPPR